MRKVLNLFGRRRNRMERDLARELQYHMDRRVEDMVRDGLTPAEAKRRAAIEFGGVVQVQEAVRDTWSWQWLDTVARDIQYSVRSLARSWGFTLGAGAVLALAIGATVAIFSVVNAVLLQPLAYPDADRLVSVETVWTDGGHGSGNVSGPDFLDWQAQSDVFERLAATYSGGDESSVIVGDRAMFASVQYVSEQFFPVFGQMPASGRLLKEEDLPADDDAEPTAAVVAFDWAATHFGSDRAAPGQTITIYGTPIQIVGVAAPGFRYPAATDIWVPMRPTGYAPNRSDHPYQAVGKLERDVDLTRAQAQMRTIGDALAREYPENRLKTATVIPLQERITGHLRSTLWLLMSAVGVLWLVGCANVASLLLARAAGRTREIAVRAALGAGRGRVTRQLLTEHGVLAAGAGLAGVLLASLLVRGVAAWSPDNVPRIDEVRMETNALLFALGISLVSTLLFGLAPALHASRLDLSNALNQGGPRSTTGKSGSRFRSALVVVEVALSVVLLVAAGLLLRSFQTLQHVDLGFTTEHVLVAHSEYAVSEGPRYADDLRARSRFYAEVLERLREVPGVSAASGVAYLGMGREPRSPRDFYIQGRSEGQPGERPQAEYHAVTADYFKTMQIPFRAGRDFDISDTPDRPAVAIVNEALARSAFPGESPIGHRLRTGTSPRAPWMEIVGVVADSRWQDPSQPARPVIYAASTQGAGNSLAILARTSMDERSLASTLRTFLHEADPTVPVEFETMEQLVDSTLSYPRFRTRLIAAFAGIAALLAAVGLFSVLACLVGQRRREIAVRRAIGAQAGSVFRLVFGQGLRLIASGLVLGLAAAFAVARLLEGLLFEVGPWDLTTYVGAVAVLGGAALLATILPAIRAVAIPPVTVLQQE